MSLFSTSMFESAVGCFIFFSNFFVVCGTQLLAVQNELLLHAEVAID